MLLYCWTHPEVLQHQKILLSLSTKPAL